MILTSCIHLTAMRRVGPVLRLPYLMPFRISLSVRLGSWGQESGWHISPSVTSASFQNSFSDAWLSGVSRYCHSSASEHVYVREPAVSSAPLSRSQPRSSGLEECCQDKSVSFITPVAEHFCHQNFASQAVAAQALLMFSSLHCTICSVPLVQPSAFGAELQSHLTNEMCQHCAAQGWSATHRACRGHNEPSNVREWAFASGLESRVVSEYPHLLRSSLRCSCCLAPLAVKDLVCQFANVEQVCLHCCGKWHVR